MSRRSKTAVYFGLAEADGAPLEPPTLRNIFYSSIGWGVIVGLITGWSEGDHGAGAFALRIAVLAVFWGVLSLGVRVVLLRRRRRDGGPGPDGPAAAGGR